MNTARVKSWRIPELIPRLFHTVCLQFHSFSIGVTIFKKETVAYESPAIIYQTTRRQMPEDSDLDVQHCETLNITARNFFISSVVIWECMNTQMLAYSINYWHKDR
jgi:hypothetical protein